MAGSTGDEIGSLVKDGLVMCSDGLPSTLAGTKPILYQIWANGTIVSMLH